MCSWKRNNLSMPSNCLYLFNPILLPFSEVVFFIPVYFLVSGSMHSWKLKLLSKNSVARLHLPLINRDLKNLLSLHCCFLLIHVPHDHWITQLNFVYFRVAFFQYSYLYYSMIEIMILSSINIEIKCEPL